MDEDRLDKFMKEKVFHHQTPTDPDLLWQQIQAKQQGPEKRKRRFFLLWWLAGGLLLCSLAGGYWLAQNANADENTVVVQPTPKLESEVPNAKTTTEESGLSTRHNEPKNTDNNHTDRLAPASSTQEIITTSELSSIESNSERKTNSEQGAIAESSLNNNDFTKNKNTHHSPVNSKANTETGADNDLSFTNMGADPTTGSTSGQPPLSAPKKSDDPSVETTKNNRTASADAVSSPTTTSPANRQFTPPLYLNSLAILLTSEPPFSINEQLQEPPPSDDGLPTKPVSKHRPFSIAGQLEYGRAFRRLTTTDHPESETYKDLRDSLETALEVLGGGVDLRWQHSSGWYAKTGLYYEQINERFDYHTGYDSTCTVDNQLVSTYIDKNGVSHDSFGIGTTRKIYSLTKEIYNRYRTFDLPLLVGYAPVKDGRWNWFAEGGIHVNLTFFPRGEILDEQGGFVDLWEDEEMLFEKRTGISLVASAGLSYRLTKRLAIWASPSFRYHLKSMTTDAHSLQQRFWRTGMRVGLQLRL